MLMETNIMNKVQTKSLGNNNHLGLYGCSENS